MEEKKKLRYWLLTAIILVGIFMTGSRGALLAWAGGVFIVFCKLFFKHISVKKIGLLCLGGVTALVAALLAEYDVDEPRAATAVAVFVKKLEDNGFLA